MVDGQVVDAKYLRQKMVEHRRRKRQQRARIWGALADSRSDRVGLEPINLQDVPGKPAADGMTSGSPEYLHRATTTRYDLARY